VLVAPFSDWSLRGTGSPSELFSVGFARSTNLGASWLVNGIHTHNIARLDLPDPSGTPWPTGWLPFQKHPSISVGGNGTVYMVAEDFRESVPPNSNSQTCIWLARSTDQGLNWSVKAVVAEAPGPAQNYVALRFPSVAADPNGADVYITWTRFEGSVGQSIRLLESDNGGETFGQEVSVSSPELLRAPMASSATVGRNGILYMVWFLSGNAPAPRPDAYLFRRRLPDGRLLPADGPRVLVQVQGLWFGPFAYNGGGYPFIPSVSNFEDYLDRASVAAVRTENLNCRSDSVYIAYVQDDYRTQFDLDYSDANVYVIASRDGGATWDAPVLVHDAPTNPTGHLWQDFGYPSQFMPAIAVSDAGHVGVAFLDRREDVINADDTPLISNQAFKQYFTYSVDGARTFVPEFSVEEAAMYSLHRVTDDPYHGWFYELVGMTEYVGIVSYGRTFHLVWMSLRKWIGPPDPERPWNWPDFRFGNRSFVGDVYTVRVEVLDGVPPDFYADCDVDLEDFTVFQLCFGGSNNPPAPTCPPGVDADMDDDGDVDLDDFTIFQLCFNGSGGGCVGAGGNCSGGGSEGGMAPEGMAPEPEPTPEQLYDLLEAWCRANGISFT